MQTKKLISKLAIIPVHRKHHERDHMFFVLIRKTNALRSSQRFLLGSRDRTGVHSVALISLSFCYFQSTENQLLLVALLITVYKKIVF